MEMRRSSPLTPILSAKRSILPKIRTVGAWRRLRKTSTPFHCRRPQPNALQTASLAAQRGVVALEESELLAILYLAFGEKALPYAGRAFEGELHPLAVHDVHPDPRHDEIFEPPFHAPHLTAGRPLRPLFEKGHMICGWTR